MKILVKDNEFKKNISYPKKNGDVGYDLKASSITVKYNNNQEVRFNDNILFEEFIKSTTIYNIDYIEYDTGICIQPVVPAKSETIFYSAIQPNSRNSKYNLILSNSRGIIDSGFRDSIRFRYKYYFQPKDFKIVKTLDDNNIVNSVFASNINYDKIYKIGDVCGQITFHSPILPTIYFTDILSDSDRGLGAFGHTSES